MIAPKHCALLAAGGFTLSVLIGLVSGNLGLLMFVRALVCGLVVGVVCLGVYGVFTFVLGVGTEARAPGSNVDISVDDEAFVGSDEDATFNLGNLMDDAGNSAQFEEARAVIDAIPSSAVVSAAEDADVAEKLVPTVENRPTAENKPTFTATPLVETGQRKALDLGNLDKMDPVIAAKTIQSMLRSEK